MKRMFGGNWEEDAILTRRRNAKPGERKLAMPKDVDDARSSQKANRRNKKTLATSHC